MHDILLIGDSLTEWNYENGWGQKMKEWFKDKANVINCGYGGYTSQTIKENIQWITYAHRFPMICTIWLGTNDCYYNGFQVPLQEYKQNIVHIIQHIRSLHTYCVILLITPPVCQLNTSILYYVVKTREIAREQCVPLVDLHKPGRFQITLSDLYDGTHINEKGNKKLFENIKHTLLTHFSIVCPDALKLDKHKDKDKHEDKDKDKDKHEDKDEI